MRIIILLSCFIFSTFFTIAQQCIPDTSITHNEPGIYPDTVVNLPHAQIGQPYQTTIQFKVKADTFYLGMTIPIDSINVVNVTGLPPGFTYSCTPFGCSFPGGSDACVLLEGPALSTVGNFPIVVQVRAHGVVLGQPTSLNANINGYRIVVDTTTGINGIDAVNFLIGQNSPNPADHYTNIPVTVNRNSLVALTVSNLIGKKVIEKQFNLQRGKNNLNLDLHGLQPGIYLYSITDGKSNITRRMIISRD